MPDLVDVRAGMRIVSSDGADLGTLVRVEGDHLVVRHGLFLPRHDAVAIADVADVQGDEVRLALPYAAVVASRVGGQGDRGSPVRREETRIPLAEEELVADKRVRELGEVRVHKRTVVERRIIEVPVRREEVSIRRVPAPRGGLRAREERRDDAPDAFTERTITIPVYEEEIEVVKRPRVAEEIRITKAFREIERRVEGTVRREEARVDRTDEDVPPGLH